MPEARSGTAHALASGLVPVKVWLLEGQVGAWDAQHQRGRQVARERMDIVKQNMQYYFDAEPVYLD